MREPNESDVQELRHLRERQLDIERRLRLLEAKLGIIHHPSANHLIVAPRRKETS